MGMTNCAVSTLGCTSTRLTEHHCSFITGRHDHVILMWNVFSNQNLTPMSLFCKKNVAHVNRTPAQGPIITNQEMEGAFRTDTAYRCCPKIVIKSLVMMEMVIVVLAMGDCCCTLCSPRQGIECGLCDFYHYYGFLNHIILI